MLRSGAPTARIIGLQSFVYYLTLMSYGWAFLRAQSVKNLPGMQETWVRFLGWEDPLEEEMANQSSILACRVPWTEESGRPQFMGLQESDTI